MKKTLLTLALTMAGLASYAQNSFPSSGNVGIGVAFPDTRLVIQASNADNLLSFWNSIGIKKAYLGTAITSGQMIQSSEAGDLIIRTENQKILFSTDAGNTAHMIITTNGNTGIGIANPDEKLVVNGTIKTILDGVSLVKMLSRSCHWVIQASQDRRIGLYVEFTSTLMALEIMQTVAI